MAIPEMKQLGIVQPRHVLHERIPLKEILHRTVIGFNIQIETQRRDVLHADHRLITVSRAYPLSGGQPGVESRKNFAGY